MWYSYTKGYYYSVIKREQSTDTSNNMAGSERHAELEARHKKLYAILLHSYQIKREAKLIYGVRNKKGCLWELSIDRKGV